MKPTRSDLSSLKYVLDNYDKPGVRHRIYFPDYGLVTSIFKDSRSEYWLRTPVDGNQSFTIRLRLSHLEIHNHKMLVRDPETSKTRELKVFVETIIW
jgi:hypothetical protein